MYLSIPIIICVLFAGVQQSMGTEISVPCSGAEKSGFEKQSTWDASCTQVCQYTCGSTKETLTNCTTPVTPATCTGTNTCSNTTGCTCPAQITVTTTFEQAVVRTLDCFNTSIKIVLDKCVLNYFGIKLGDLFLGTPSDLTKTQLAAVTPNDTCRGITSYENGPSYVLDYTFAEKDSCNAIIEQTTTELIFKTAIHGLSGGSGSAVDRTSVFRLNFQCTYQRNYTKTPRGFLTPTCAANETFANGTCISSAYFQIQLPLVTRVFDAQLNDRTSTLYAAYTTEAEKIARALFMGINMPPLQIVILGFKNGSVIIDFAVELRVNPLTPPMDVQMSLSRYIVAVMNNQIPSSDPNVALLMQYSFGPLSVGKITATQTEILSKNPCYTKLDTCHTKAICKAISVTDYVCTCAGGYVDVLPSNPGHVCHSPCDATNEGYCLNNGICVIEPISGSPRCLCQAEYMGVTCQDLKANEPIRRLLEILPWVAAAILLIFFGLAIVLYCRRRAYMKKTFAKTAFMPDTRPSNSDAVVGLMRHSEQRTVLE
nr:uncharacterized protein LOC100182537 [Ciona intestinalis]|eukprot:XP_002126238.1 uncharacterized protein LOC100182537 [Ciona intestinalis]